MAALGRTASFAHKSRKALEAVAKSSFEAANFFDLVLAQRGLHNEGFQLFMTCQTRVRDNNNHSFVASETARMVPASSGSYGEPAGKAGDSAPTPGSAVRTDFWLSDHIAGLRGRRNLNDQQKRFMVLADTVSRTSDEEHEFTTLADAERAAEDARRKPQPEVTADNTVPPVDREHQLSRPAELLVLAGLLDSRTGEPVWDRAELLGALLELAATPADSEARATWKRIGSAMLNAASRHQRSPR